MRVIAALALLLTVVAAPMVHAEPFGPQAFRDVWERTDYPVQVGLAQHSWIWGPEAFTPALREYFIENGRPGTRQVQYIDKGRMEINNPDADQSVPWYVTSGLLGRELIDGQVQIGYDAFVPLAPANIAVVGDPDNQFPTYASLARLYETPAGDQVGDQISRVFLPEGAGEFAQYADDPAAQIVRIERGFGIPRAFWNFMNQGGTIYRNGQFQQADQLFDWLYVTGYPITDAHWTRVRIGGVERDVLFQAFERRVLSYTPANPGQFQVEMGNIGRHYYAWRYEQAIPAGRQAIITLPSAGANVNSPLMVQGFERGQAFEAGILVRLRNQAGDVLAEQPTTVQRPDINYNGPFSATLNFAQPARPTSGMVEVVVSSPRDGSQTVIASQPVTIGGNEGQQPGQAPVDQVRQDLANRLGVAPGAVTIQSVEPVEWANAALECPAPDEAYATVVTPGYRIIAVAQGAEYIYHTDTGNQIRLCENGRPVPPPQADDGAPIAVPAANAQVTLPLHIQANLGEPGRQVTAELALANNIVFSDTLQVLAGPDGNGLVIGSLDWRNEGPPPNYESQPATLTIRGPEGNNLAARQVRILDPDSAETTSVDLYWLIGEDFASEQRVVPATQEIGATALEELLWGPAPRNQAGFGTAIPTPEEVLNYPGREDDWGPRVRLLGLTIENGVATANFSQELRAYGGGSTRVQHIRDQITRTLQQFPTVNEVQIAIEGQTEGVLQP
ncbi:MAG: hypothetical protein HC822_15400 [Oscillochloris sp.]|nr:hypothetical protein [Oscillochloris sp.]